MEEFMKFDNKDIILETKDNISYLKFRKLLEFEEIEHGFYVGLDLDFKTQDINKNIIRDNFGNYEKFFNLFNLNYINCIKPIFSHSNNVLLVDKKVNINEPDFYIYDGYDVLITNKDNLILTTTSADCNLILLYDKKKRVIANVHSGWKGTFSEVCINTLKKMKSEYQSDYKDIMCFILPSIRACHFEVDDDIYDKFKAKFKDSKYYHFYNKWHIDLALIIKDGLISLGVSEDNIIDSNICTMCNSNTLHSYRKNKDKFGVSVGFIMLRK